MKMNESKKNGSVVLTLSDEITLQKDQEAITGLVEKRIEEGERSFVIDLSDVAYLSSLGLGTLVSAHTKLRRVNGRLALVNPAPGVSEILKVTQLSEIFNIFPTVDEATAHKGSAK